MGSVSERRASEKTHTEGERERVGEVKDSAEDKGSDWREIRGNGMDRDGQAMENQLEGTLCWSWGGEKLEKIVKSPSVPRLFFPFFSAPLNGGDVACLRRGEGTQFGTIYSAVFSLIYLRDREWGENETEGR